MTVHVHAFRMQSGLQIGVLALSAPERINAQNLAMVRQMCKALQEWQTQDDVVGLVLLGAGERGFCAGGDLKALYQAMDDPSQLASGEAFFAEEYALCAAIRVYPKPVLAWGHGIVMGGGWGLFAAASHRVVTPTSQLAMPETAIGLFPDVAASWWLPTMAGCGEFLALSGSAINASDAIWCGAAQWALADDMRHRLIADLLTLPWQTADSAHALLSEYLATHAQPLAEGNLARHAEDLRVVGEGDLFDAVARCAAGARSDDAYLRQAAQRIQAASPTSLWLAWTLQQRCKQATLAQTVALETQLSAVCLRYGDFKAGIAAKLMTRGSAPQWRVSEVAELDFADLSATFPMLFAEFI